MNLQIVSTLGEKITCFPHVVSYACACIWQKFRDSANNRTLTIFSQGYFGSI